jgi:hypothetical protein
MKKLLCLLAFGLVSAASVHAQSVADLDTKYGFRDLAFETDTSAIEGLTLGESSNFKLLAQRPADNKKVGGATISKIEYSFFQGRLYEVTLTTKGLVNSHALREALEGQYGEGELVSTAGQDKNWIGKRVRLTYREDPAFHNGVVRFTCKKLAEELAKSQKSGKKASSDL